MCIEVTSLKKVKAWESIKLGLKPALKHVSTNEIPFI